MDAARIYDKNSNLQKDFNISVITRYFRMLTWRENERIMDIGSGDGSFTALHLLPELPKDLKELVGSDVGSDRVKYARDNYGSSKVKFICMDIQSKKLADTYNETFDHIFSFFCLSWVRDLRVTFDNIFSMLKPGGEILVTTPEYGVQRAFHNLAQYPRWSSFGHEEFISPLIVNLGDAFPVWKQLIEDAGFVDLHCFREVIVYRHKSRQECEDLARSVNPIARRVPDQDLQDYYTDYLKEMRAVKMIGEEICSDTQETVSVTSMTQLTFYARKPLAGVSNVTNDSCTLENGKGTT